MFEINLADLQGDADQGHRKIKLVCEDVQGKNVLTNFYGMEFTRDKLCSMIKKWQTLIEACADVKTTDGYVVRMFCIGFTDRRKNQIRKTSYAQATQIRQIRQKMIDIMTAEAAKGDLKDLVTKFLPESLGAEIRKATQFIYPLQNVCIRKVRILKAPKFDLVKFMELHSDAAEDTGAKVAVAEAGEVEQLEGAGGRL